jgi:hypothetical protein
MTSLRLPPGVLAEGGRYVLLVRAIERPNDDPASAPFRFSLPRSAADAYTDVIVP